MRIGFIEPATNPESSFESALEAAKQFAGMELVKSTAPDVLKIPAAAKKQFNDGVDCVVAFISASNEHEMSLLQEKIIDVEVHHGKYVFLAVSDQKKASEAINHALSQAAEFCGNIDAGIAFMQQSENEAKDLLSDNGTSKLF